MGCGRVDGDEQIELSDDGRGIGKIGDLGTEVKERLARRRAQGVFLARSFLQADEAHARYLPQRCKGGQAGQRTVSVVLVLRITFPHQANLEATRRQSVTPAGRSFGQDMEIRQGGRNGVAGGAQMQRHAEGEAPVIVRWNGVQAGDDLIRTVHSFDQGRCDCGLHQRQTRETLSLEQGSVTDELDIVAMTLLGNDHQRLACQRFALPLRPGKLGVYGMPVFRVRGIAGLVIRPGLGIPPQGEQQQAKIQAGVGVARL